MFPVLPHSALHPHDPSSHAFRVLALAMLLPGAAVLGPGGPLGVIEYAITDAAMLELDLWRRDSLVVIEREDGHAALFAGSRNGASWGPRTLDVAWSPEADRGVPGADHDADHAGADDSMIVLPALEIPIFTPFVDPGPTLGLDDEDLFFDGFADTPGGGGGSGGGVTHHHDDPVAADPVFIPAPGSAATLALASIAATRRRRSA